MRKRWWRIAVARMYIAWRKNRVSCIYSVERLLPGKVIIMVFKPNSALSAKRKELNTGGRNPAWINMSRRWQIKAGLNYGRY